MNEDKEFGDVLRKFMDVYCLDIIVNRNPAEILEMNLCSVDHIKDLSGQLADLCFELIEFSDILKHTDLQPAKKTKYHDEIKKIYEQWDDNSVNSDKVMSVINDDFSDDEFDLLLMNDDVSGVETLHAQN